MKFPFWDYLLKQIQLKHYGMWDTSVVAQNYASIKPERFLFSFFITYVMKIYHINCVFWSVEMYKGSTAAEKKSEYKHV